MRRRVGRVRCRQVLGEVGEAVFGGELGADLDHAGELSMHQTCEARWARSWETRPSPAPRSAMVMAGVRPESEVADGFQERPGAVGFAEAAGDEVEYCSCVRRRFWRMRSRLARSSVSSGSVATESTAARRRASEAGRDGGAGGSRRPFRPSRSVGDEAGLAEEGELGGDAATWPMPRISWSSATESSSRSARASRRRRVGSEGLSEGCPTRRSR